MKKNQANIETPKPKTQNSKLFRQTPSQTIGPFFAHGLTAEQYNYNFTSIAQSVIADATVAGEHILLTGKVYDGEGKAAVDAMLEFWQCDAEGNYSHQEQDPKATGFRGFGRIGTGTSNDLSYEISSIKPGAIGDQAPFINLTLFMRGMLNHQYTRIYFADEEQLNAQDKVLNLVPKSRQKTLIAQRQEIAGRVIYHFDIHMQGDQETVFFDL